MLIIVTGGIGRSVTGGQAWAVLNYLLGLRALGHEVWYLEDCGEWSVVYDWGEQTHSWDLDHPARYIYDCLEPHGFGERWIYRTGNESRGRSLSDLRDLCAAADLLLVRGIPFLSWRKEYDLPRRRAFIDVDPGFTQIRIEYREPAFIETLAHCERLFTVGQRLGAPDCPIPCAGFSWQPTLPPVYLPQWPVASEVAEAPFTSVIRWRGLKDVRHGGVLYGQRDREFPRFLEVPRRTGQPFLIAVTGGNEELLTREGWNVMPGWVPSATPESYRNFIQSSRAEFGVAKHCYVATRSGWVSDRSVCYLASGRPVLVQDTCIRDFLPTGEGLLTFADPDEAVNGVDAVCADYQSHRSAARRIAEEHLATERVLPGFLDQAVA